MISYKPLFKLLVEHDMNKTQFRQSVGLSTATLAKLSKGEYISLDNIEKICCYFNCPIQDVVEIIAEKRD